MSSFWHCNQVHTNAPLVVSWKVLFDPISLHILLLFFFLFLFFLGRPWSRKPKVQSFQIGSGWNLEGMFFKFMRIDWRSRIFDLTSITLSRWRIWRHFCAANCCHLASAHAAFAQRTLLHMQSASSSVYSSWSIVYAYLFLLQYYSVDLYFALGRVSWWRRGCVVNTLVSISDIFFYVMPGYYLDGWLSANRWTISVRTQPPKSTKPSIVRGRQIEYQPLWLGLGGASSLV